MSCLRHSGTINISIDHKHLDKCAAAVSFIPKRFPRDYVFKVDAGDSRIYELI